MTPSNSQHALDTTVKSLIFCLFCITVHYCNHFKWRFLCLFTKACNCTICQSFPYNQNEKCLQTRLFPAGRTKFTKHLQMGLQLSTAGLRIFQLHNGAKAIHTQWKPYLKLWISILPQFRKPPPSEHLDQRSNNWDTLTTVLHPCDHSVTFSTVFSELQETDTQHFINKQALC